MDAKNTKIIAVLLCFLTMNTSTYAQDFAGVSPAQAYYIGNVPLSVMPLQIFVKKYVEDSISVWQKKGKIEKSDVYRKRISNERQAKIDQLMADAVKQAKAAKIKTVVWKFASTENYDADNENYLMSVGKDFSNIVLKVSPTEVEGFDKAFSTGKLDIVNPDLAYSDKWVLKSFTVVNKLNNKQYKYTAQTAGTYQNNQFNLAIEDVNVVLEREDVGGGKVVNNKAENLGASDVDLNIPVSPQTNDKTFAVIIANENYTREVKVQYAANDGKIFKQYCEKTLGIPAKNIHFSHDATYGTMKSEMKWIADVTAAYNGQAKVIFYYAGHGMPDEKDKSAYLLPTDGFSSDFETAIKLDDLYARLTATATQSVTVILDACFSGSVRDNGMLANARSVKIKPTTGVMSGNMVVFSAATGEETAYPYKEKQHGLFTYFLLKKLQETKGDITYENLSDFIIENVKQQSIVVNQKLQTPQVNVSQEVQETWKTMKLK